MLQHVRKSQGRDRNDCFIYDEYDKEGNLIGTVANPKTDGSGGAMAGMPMFGPDRDINGNPVNLAIPSILKIPYRKNSMDANEVVYHDGLLSKNHGALVSIEL